MRDFVHSLLPATMQDNAGLQTFVSWDFSLPLKVLKRDEGMSESEAKDCLAEYLVYMDGILRGERETSPSKKADKMWHSHILCTEDYARFCKTVFGRFIHHVPKFRDTNRCSTGRCADSGHGCVPRS